MRKWYTTFLAIVVLVPFSAAAFGTDSSAQPPQLLGVWYGEYEVETGGEKYQAEMWMEISSQESSDGWSVRGHNRWNVIDELDEKKKGADFNGREFEHYDAVSGEISRDGKTLTFTEEQRESRIDANLVAADTINATFYPHKSGIPGFSVTLKRINSHYSPSDINVLGIDISHHSGNVDWKQVKQQGYRFAYVKSSEGVDLADPMFEQHWKSLSELGIHYGAYHFYVTEDDPVEQARFFASRIRDNPGTLPPAVDVEALGHDTTGDMTEILLLFLSTLKKELGVTPIIYTSPNFWDKYYRPEFSEYHLWMAEYGVTVPNVPFGWNKWLLWQRKGNKQVKGVENTVDINMVHPDIDIDTLRIKE
ncbi:MAG: hypothetical protein DHS20C01_31750 [marine bacterium B5-7]|nr:MAG: hypothetical protein DHS20C01_31750 [marine bacterium B5-7]